MCVQAGRGIGDHHFGEAGCQCSPLKKLAAIQKAAKVDAEELAECSENFHGETICTFKTADGEYWIRPDSGFLAKLAE